MTRWHRATCQSPEVIVDSEDNRPQCRECGSSCPSEDELLAAQATVSSPSTLPPDKPRGQMDLYWPSEALYESTLDPGGPNRRREHTRKENLDASSTFSLNAHIYPNSLDAKQIRLVCLTSTPDADHPLHVTLEVYDHDNRPEYEAVSYMWGGEDGNSVPCHPIYIGPYWDVLLQTANCYSMLEFVRPWRGIRMLWIDALCINQSDLEEREKQVGKMLQIYEECTRVVVYLGPDVALKTSRFPSYKPLDQIDLTFEQRIVDSPADSATTTLSMKELLERAYFSRVWMIQELSVSARAVIRIGNTDYCADASIMERISSLDNRPFAWEKTAAPWVQYLGQRSSSMPSSPATAMLQVANLTARCHASDPRDKLFAILPLLQLSRDRKQQSLDTICQTLSPDYTLSFQHFSVGLFGYILIDLQFIALLEKAGSARQAPKSHKSGCLPSWVPECRSYDQWKGIFGGKAVPDDWFKSLPERESVDVSLCSDPLTMLYDSGYRAGTHRKWVGHYVGLNRTKHNSLENAYIVPNTGALVLSVIHLFAFESVPRVTQRNGRLYEYEIAPSHELLKWRFLSLALLAQERIDIQPYRDHVFCVITPSVKTGGPWQDGIVYLILREALVEEGMPTFTLVSASVTFSACDRRKGGDTLFSPHYRRLPRITASKTHDLSNLCLPLIRVSVADTLERIMQNFLVLGAQLHHIRHLLRLPLSEKDWPDVSRLSRALWQDEEDEKNGAQPRNLLKEALFASDISPSSVLSRHNNRTLSSRRIKLVLQEARDRMQDHDHSLLLESVRHAYSPPLMMESLFDMLKQGPTEEQRYVGTVKYVGGVKMDGSARKVRII